MLGNFQQSQLRIEIQASNAVLRESILNPQEFSRWMWPQQFSTDLPVQLTPGLTFTSQLGLIKIKHEVLAISEQEAKFLLSEGIDGIHEWIWGEGWVQSLLEGVSVLPLNLGQTIALYRLRQFAEARQQKLAST
ncbi:MAG: hypothetical protein VKL39_05050 [Leptolyngbyaceae bacterium]|nr:hypothetical protein [Leptolyngbyaceae bacterium]